MDFNEIEKVFQSKGLTIADDDAWKVQKVWVVKHKALERLGEAFGIRWHDPQLLRFEADEAVILVKASLADKPDIMEWSIGEAKIVRMVPTGKKNKWGKDEVEAADGATGNYQIAPKQASYPYAMAEKRGKDRVIIKLCGLHGTYSEDESDDFKKANATKDDDTQSPANSNQGTAPANDSAPKPLTYDDQVSIEQDEKKIIDGKASVKDLAAFMNDPKTVELHGKLPDAMRKDLRAYGMARYRVLSAEEKARAAG